MISIYYSVFLHSTPDGCFWFGTVITSSGMSIFICLLVHEGRHSEHISLRIDLLDTFAHPKEEREAEQTGVQKIGVGVWDSVNTLPWAGTLEVCTALSHVP